MLTCSGSLMLVGEGPTARDADQRHWPYLLWIRCSVIGPLEQGDRVYQLATSHVRVILCRGRRPFLALAAADGPSLLLTASTSALLTRANPTVPPRPLPPADHMNV